MTHASTLHSFLEQAIGENLSILSVNEVGGGCINSAQKISLNDGRIFFIKQNRTDRLRMFETELLGLQRLEQTGVVKVPRPIQVGQIGNSACLLLEWVETQQLDRSSSKRLGRMLAELHRHKGAESYGFEVDNFLGATSQLNTWMPSWPEFFVSRRLEPQLSWAQDKGFDFPGTTSEKFWNHVTDRLSTDPTPSLIHGDLWAGNYLIGPQGQPYLIDPAPYWAHHEAEFGILTLFGGFDSDFFDAYREQIPVADGFDERLEIYQLYHYLNHLNLFGASYLDQCHRILRRLI